MPPALPAFSLESLESSEQEAEGAGWHSVVHAFFREQTDMQRAITVFCGTVPKQSTDIITPTVLMMLNSTLQMQLTAVGWQPFRSRDLTYPYHAMTQAQRAAILGLLVPEHEDKWAVFDHAMVYRRARGVQVIQLKPIDVLGALCSLVLASDTYPDKRLRLAVCNILLQRVQASIVLDKHTQMALNQRLFAPTTPASSSSLNPSHCGSPTSATTSATTTKKAQGGAISPVAAHAASVRPETLSS